MITKRLKLQQASEGLPRQSEAAIDRGQHTDGRTRGGTTIRREENESARGQGNPLDWTPLVAHHELIVQSLTVPAGSAGVSRNLLYWTAPYTQVL